MPVDEEVSRAATAIEGASAVIIAAGAGMGVDSGLPDFRGDRGFWNAYPPFERLGLSFIDLANPGWFHRDPALAWGFYGHRLELYRRTVPHHGFTIALEWTKRAPLGGFVFTSNVDGQFQKAGYTSSRIVECHGSIHVLQCLVHCGMGLFPADDYGVSVDESTMRASQPLPCCPGCGGLARPNVLMFGDWDWNAERTMGQERALDRWLGSVTGPLVVVECGAGTSVPSVRYFSERTVKRFQGTLVRVNSREADVPFPYRAPGPAGVGIALGAEQALRAIDSQLGRRARAVPAG
jgi:NAD-dependent SIR2 family protein deacetylase